MSEGEQVAQTTQKGQGKQQDQEQERSYEPRPKNTTKLQIKNLQYNTPREEVNELCRRYGTITLLEVKGTSAFVTFSKADEAQLAIHKLEGMLSFS
jgi:RNA recognition motif-containing protein